MSKGPEISPAETSRRSLRSHPAFLPAVICAAVALVYVGTLAFGFVYDDLFQIVDNKWLTSARYIPRYFTSHVWAFADIAGTYWRPLFLLWFFLNRMIFGLAPAGWHASTVLVHAVTTALVYALARRLTDRRDVGVIAALVFGVHPVMVESVSWISAVADPLLGAVLIPSFFYNVDWRRSGSKRALAISLAFYTLALLAKEPAVMLVPLIAIHTWIFPETSGRGEGQGRDLASRVQAAWRATYLYLPLTAVYVLLHLKLMSAIDYSTSKVTTLDNLLTVPSILTRYLRLLFWPAPISPSYDVRPIERFSVAGVLLPALVIAVVAALFLWWTRRRPGMTAERENERRVLRFGAAWAVLFVLPVLYLKPLVAFDFVHPRYLYLPSIGFALVIAVALGRLQGGREWMGLPALRVAAAGALVLVLAVVNIPQQIHWASNLLLYTRGLQVAPHNPIAQTSLAIELGKRQQYPRAIALLQEALQTDPDDWHANFSLGYTYFVMGRTQEAEPLLDKAVRIHPQDADPDQWAYLGMAELRLKNLPKAEWAVRHAVERRPDTARYRLALALILEERGDRDQAIREFRETLRLDPSNQQASAALAKLTGAAND